MNKHSASERLRSCTRANCRGFGRTIIGMAAAVVIGPASGADGPARPPGTEMHEQLDIAESSESQAYALSNGSLPSVVVDNSVKRLLPARAGAAARDSEPRREVVALDGHTSVDQGPTASSSIDEPHGAHPSSWSTTSRLVGTFSLVGASVLLDRSADRWAVNHHRNGFVRVLRVAGDDAPVVLAALAAGDAFFRTDSEDGRIAWESVKASVATAAIVEATKIGIDRSRPTLGRGSSDFGHEKRADSSFPSFHTAVAWSLITPAAEHYDAPWLYGVAALTNFSRVAGRDHWLSDTVAGAAIGWWMGDLFHKQALATDGRSTATFIVVPNGLVVTASFR